MVSHSSKDHLNEILISEKIAFSFNISFCHVFRCWLFCKPQKRSQVDRELWYGEQSVFFCFHLSMAFELFLTWMIQNAVLLLKMRVIQEHTSDFLHPSQRKQSPKNRNRMYHQTSPTAILYFLFCLFLCSALSHGQKMEYITHTKKSEYFMQPLAVAPPYLRESK